MIFILGGRGFVGSAFARVCERAGRDFLVIDRKNYSEVIGKSCAVLINAAGNSRKYLPQHNPLQDFDESVRSVRASLIDFTYNHYVHLSSCDVYPDCTSPQTTSEEQQLDVSRQSPYGFHKYLAEQCVRHAAKKWLIARFGGFVGAGLKKNPIFDILNGGQLWLDPESELQFMDVERAADIVLTLIEKDIQNDTFNICGRGVLKLREVINWTGLHVLAQPGSPVVRYEVDIAKISALVDMPDTRNTVKGFMETVSKGYSSRRIEQ
jgi:nucleoside-diphosphate-sugar epimerase